MSRILEKELHNSNTVQLRIMVGWVERSETQKRIDNVGFRPSTQPTPMYFVVCREYWKNNYMFSEQRHEKNHGRL